jgi:ABC-type phosphate transport system substrate-binding protein
MMTKARVLLLIVLMLATTAVFAEEVAVVVNPNVKISEVSSNDLRDVFNGDKSSLGGVHVVPVTLKGGPAHEAFLKAHVGKSDSAFRASWRSLVFTGQGSLPKSFETEAALIDYVAATPGAVGYVSRSTNREKVKTLVVR